MRAQGPGAAVLIGLAALLFAGSVWAGAFSRGRTQFSLSIGNGRAFDQNYVVYGASVSYYLLDGLGVGADAQSWTDATPGIRMVSPHVHFVWRLAPSFNPYVGTFYRRLSIDGYPDRNSYGYRAGIYVRSGAHAYLGVGVVYDRLLNCDASLYRTCSDTYPEAHLLFTL